jgi:hypothetical protein
MDKSMAMTRKRKKNPSKIINTPTQGLTTILANMIPI